MRATMNKAKSFPEHWSPPQRPIDYAESALINAILSGTFPPGSALPGERELSAHLGITRPTLREVLARLARDGWLVIQQGKPTRINNPWREGGLNVLAGIVRHAPDLPASFIPNLLEVRLALAPAYARAAIGCNPGAVSDFLEGSESLPDEPPVFAAFDWRLHYSLTVSSGNPVYTLILNGFAGFYEQMACQYFTYPAARRASHLFYARLTEAAHQSDAAAAEIITRHAMAESIDLWRSMNGNAETSDVTR